MEIILLELMLYHSQCYRVVSDYLTRSCGNGAWIVADIKVKCYIVRIASVKKTVKPKRACKVSSGVVTTVSQIIFNGKSIPLALILFIKQNLQSIAVAVIWSEKGYHIVYIIGGIAITVVIDIGCKLLLYRVSIRCWTG